MHKCIWKYVKSCHMNVQYMKEKIIQNFWCHWGILGLKLCGTYNVPVHSKDAMSNDRKIFREEAENRLIFFIFEFMWNKKRKKATNIF